jgi:YidC/Oxa1 family membrane protein insertase
LLHLPTFAALIAFDNPWTSLIGALANWISVVLDFINAHVTHNYGWSMLVLALVATLVMLPLYLQQFRSVKEMQAIQPYVKRLQEKFKDDKQKLAEEQMKLFKEHNINPFGGCLPTLIQLPIFFAIYQAIQRHSEQFAHAGWMWIGSAMSAHSPAIPSWVPGGLAGPIFAANLSQPDKLLTLFYAISMFFSFQMTTAVTSDPMQQQQQKLMSVMMPVMMFFIGQHFIAGFVLYWLGLNIFSTTLRFWAMRAPSKIPAPPQETAATLAGYPLHCPNCKELLTVAKSKCAACGVKVKKVGPGANGKLASGTTVTLPEPKR